MKKLATSNLNQLFIFLSFTGLTFAIFFVYGNNSDATKKAFIQAGANRPELEEVIEHY
jgi:hypothetical protein